jgi:hypothetical protein
MIDYSEHLTQMDKITRQMKDALRSTRLTMAYDLSMMLLKETELLTLNIAELKREQESRQS